MRRLTLALLSALALAPGVPPAWAADPHTIREAHRHPGYLFRIRFEPEMNTHYVYSVYHADPANPDGLLVQRADGYLGDAGFVDLNPASCPALGRLVAALADLPMPVIAIEPPRASRYDTATQPRGEHYYFDGFIRFANGAEGEFSFMSYDVPGRPVDPQLEWMRGLVRAFDACRPRRPRRD